MSLPERKIDHSYEHSHSTPSKQETQLAEAMPYLVPKSKLSRVSKLEKVVFIALVITFLLLAVATIRMTTSVNREEEAISALQVEMIQSQQEIETLEQEKNELLRTERVKGIAEKAGIELRDDNIRKIK